MPTEERAPELSRNSLTVQHDNCSLALIIGEPGTPQDIGALHYIVSFLLVRSSISPQRGVELFLYKTPRTMFCMARCVLVILPCVENPGRFSPQNLTI